MNKEARPIRQHATSPDLNLGVRQRHFKRLRKSMAAAAVAGALFIPGRAVYAAEPNPPTTTSATTSTPEKPAPNALTPPETKKDISDALPGITLAVGVAMVLLSLGAFVKSGRNIVGEQQKDR